MTEVRVPKLNNNDSHYVLLEWLVADGARVCAGDAVAVVETSKAAEELVCETEGTLRHLLGEGTECEPGQALATVDGPAEVKEVAQPDATAPAGLVVTAPARARLAELGIGVERLSSLGQRVIRRDDVDRLLRLEQEATDKPAERYELPRHQQAVASVVARSHATIPPAYLAIRVEVAEALDLAARLRGELRRFVGLPELVVAAVARQHARFPLCFAAVGDDGSVSVAASPHVGVTVDMGTGLYVPVIHDAANRTLAEITEAMARFRDTALRGRFRASELAGATILLALHTDDDVLFGVPIVFPGHTCALSLSGVRQEATVEPDGTLCARPVVTLGVAHDHRVVNGQDAMAFLRAVKAALRDPEDLMRCT